MIVLAFTESEGVKMPKAVAKFSANPDIDRWFDGQTGGCTIHRSALACSKHLVGRYFSGDYTGSLFDPLGIEPANVITRADLYAVSTLAMPTFAWRSNLDKMISVIDEDNDQSVNCHDLSCTSHVSCMLKRIPRKARIFSPLLSKLTLANDSLWPALEELLRSSLGEAGPAELSKTLARKRPGLLPILDSVAVIRLKKAGAKQGAYWRFFREEFRRSTVVVPAIVNIRRQGNVPQHISDLRIVDVAVWMRQSPDLRPDLRVVKDRSSCPPLP